MTSYQITIATRCCLRRVRRGVYVATKICDDPAHRFVSMVAAAESTDLPRETVGMRKRGEDLRILVRSYVNDPPLDAVFSHRSALIIHGLPIPYFEQGEAICAEAVHAQLGVRRSSLLIRKRLLGDEDIVLVDGALVTSMLRTLFDIAHDCPRAFAVAVADAAVRQSLVTVNEFREYCASKTLRTYQNRIDAVIELIDARRESVAESITAVRLDEHSVTGFEPQVVICDEHGDFIARTDFADEEAKVIAEFDGAGKYYLNGADPKQAFELERQREYLLRNCGYIVFRLTWRDLFRGDVFLRIKDAVNRRSATAES